MNNFSKEKIDALCKEISYCTGNNYRTKGYIKLASFLHEHAIKKALELLEAGKKIQIEFDTKNSILKVFELNLKRIPIGGIEQ